MDLFGMNRFFDGSGGERPPKTGPGRWFQAFWDNLGGLLGGGFLQAGSLFAQLLGGGEGPALPVWAVLCVDFLLLSLAAAVVFPALCAGEGRLEPGRLVSLLAAAPGRVCGAAVMVLAWCGLGAALFPVSVPFALVIGFWPPALVTAQLLLPGLERVFGLPDWEPDQREGPPPGTASPPDSGGRSGGGGGARWW